MRRIALVVLLVMAALSPFIVLADTAKQDRIVTIDNFTFAPKELTVAAGTKVVWVNHDDIPHTIVSSGGARLFKSPPLDTDDKFSITFNQPGTYRYFCSIHPMMTGTIVVK